MSIHIGANAGGAGISISHTSSSERTQRGVDDAGRTLSDTAHEAEADDRRLIDRAGALDALLREPSPLDRFAGEGRTP